MISSKNKLKLMILFTIVPLSIHTINMFFSIFSIHCMIMNLILIILSVITILIFAFCINIFISKNKVKKYFKVKNLNFDNVLIKVIKYLNVYIINHLNLLKHFLLVKFVSP